MTTFKAPVKTWSTIKEGAGADVGYSVQAQTVLLQAATAATVENSFYIPPFSKVTGFVIDNQVLWDATTAALTIGSASAGAQYLASLDVKANGGRTAGAATAAIAVTLEGIVTAATATRMFVTITSTDPTATGTTRVTVEYITLASSSVV